MFMSLSVCVALQIDSSGFAGLDGVWLLLSLVLEINLILWSSGSPLKITLVFVLPSWFFMFCQIKVYVF